MDGKSIAKRRNTRPTNKRWHLNQGVPRIGKHADGHIMLGDVKASLQEQGIPPRRRVSLKMWFSGSQLAAGHPGEAKVQTEAKLEKGSPVRYSTEKVAPIRQQCAQVTHRGNWVGQMLEHIERSYY
jgi:hypothetical protein